MSRRSAPPSSRAIRCISTHILRRFGSSSVARASFRSSLNRSCSQKLSFRGAPVVQHFDFRGGIVKVVERLRPIRHGIPVAVGKGLEHRRSLAVLKRLTKRVPGDGEDRQPTVKAQPLVINRPVIRKNDAQDRRARECVVDRQRTLTSKTAIDGPWRVVPPDVGRSSGRLW